MINHHEKLNAKTIQEGLEKWYSNQSLSLYAASLEKLFQETYLLNNCIDEVTIKVTAINSLYKTRIMSVDYLINHIINLNIDTKLAIGDSKIVNQMAQIEINGKKYNFYSFATKYACEVEPYQYPFYDNYVSRALNDLQEKFNFTSKFTQTDLRDYTKYKNIVYDFREFFQLHNFSMQDICRYLWQYTSDNLIK